MKNLTLKFIIILAITTSLFSDKVCFTENGVETYLITKINKKEAILFEIEKNKKIKLKYVKSDNQLAQFSRLDLSFSSGKVLTTVTINDKLMMEYNVKTDDDVTTNIYKCKEIIKKPSKKVKPISESKKLKEKEYDYSVIDDYLQNIEKIVMQYFEPPIGSKGNTTQLVITLNAEGNLLECRVLRYSSNQELNHESERMKEKLKKVVFPRNPDNMTSKIVVNLHSEG